MAKHKVQKKKAIEILAKYVNEFNGENIVVNG